MDFTFFYTKEQLSRFINSRFNSTVLGSHIERDTTTTVTPFNKEGYLPPELASVLDEIAITKQLMDPVIEACLDQMKCEPVWKLLKCSNNTKSWREKSFLMRTCVLASGGEFTEPLQKAACAIELLGMSFCLTDDLLDESVLYDCKPTAWKEYGYKETICLSAVISSLAHGVLIDASHEAKMSLDESRAVASTFRDICLDTYVSQFMDLESEKVSDLSEERYFEMISRFPGTLYAGAVNIACLLAHADANTGDILKKIARLLAMVNQIRDDLVEIVGDEEVIGKKVGADVLRNKKRLPLIAFLKENAEWCDAFYNTHMESPPIDAFLCRIQSSSALRVCMEHIDRLAHEGSAHIAELRESKWKHVLDSLMSIIRDFELLKA